MKKWISWAIAYLVIVIAAYNIYGVIVNDGVAIDDQHDSAHSSDGSMEEGGDDHSDDHGSHGDTPADSEVEVSVNVSGDKLTIYATDLSGNPVEELEISHEKLLHLIIIDDHLANYYHLHPEQIDVGTFQTFKSLPDGSYKAFIDIKPVGLDYVVKPIDFTIGEKTASHGHASLEVDQSLTKTVNNQKVELTVSSLEVGEPVSLSFALPDAKVEPYLGAMGHVVILDEHAENYIHVHPKNETETIFETQFDQPGLYKLWGEFKIGGEVLVYPFVIEVK